MSMHLPPVQELRASLEALTHAQVQKLSADSGVPFTTLWKIRDGTTTNPGIETVRRFYEKLVQAQAAEAAAAEPEPKAA